jgi:alkylation response protein AidB-like acyl-CoA dehydrogenase
MRRPIFTPEHDDLRESFGRYLDKEVVHAYDGWEKEGRIPRAALRRAGELGFLGFGVPEAFGGPGAEDFRFNAVINEEAGHHDAERRRPAVPNRALRRAAASAVAARNRRR